MTLHKSNNYFADFEQAKNLIVILLTLNKLIILLTLSKLIFLLTLSKSEKVGCFFLTTQLGHLWLPTLYCAVPV